MVIFFIVAYYVGINNIGSAEVKDCLIKKENGKQLLKENTVVVNSIVSPPWSVSLFKFFL